MPGNVPTESPTQVDVTIEPSSPTVLANGLQVLVTPIADATSVAVVVTYDVGSHHDPPGQSGLAHFAEHLLVTSATSAEPARSVEDLVATYPLGWNAQTGSDYTVIASVVTPDDLPGELARMAARLAGVTATIEDAERERPRVLAEVENMFGGIASLAVGARTWRAFSRNGSRARDKIE